MILLGCGARLVSDETMIALYEPVIGQIEASVVDTINAQIAGRAFLAFDYSRRGGDAARPDVVH